MMSKWWLIGVAAAIAGVGIGYLMSDTNGADPHYRDAPASHSHTEPQAMVPWRNPESDTAALFPGAATPPTDAPQILSLSRRRREIQDALGPDTPLAGNALYLYPVTKAGTPVGVVMLRRARGEWGAIEVVVGMKPGGEVVGVRIQRHREPPEIARYLTSPAFLDSFIGNTPADRFTPGADLPTVSKDAETSARAVAQAVRALCIEYHAGTRP